MRILAIETSCDETAIAIADFTPPFASTMTSRRNIQQMRRAGFTRIKNSVHVSVSSHIISSQVNIHKKFGGVVPNLARREHEKNLVPILIQTLAEAKLKTEKRPARSKKLDSILEREQELLAHFKTHITSLPTPDIDAIAVTYGPGLAPALWVGVNFARALSYLWNKPLIPVNHMAGHLYSSLLQQTGVISNSKFQIPKIKLPALALLVSGGHTELVLMRGHDRFKIIGETLDDAVGEAFDKVARILHLSYPGGPEIARLAAAGNPTAYTLPRPMQHTKDYNFSFSGLKTAVLYLVRDMGKLTPQKKKDVAASFQVAAVEVLVAKTIRATKEYQIKTLLVGGGVAANATLRRGLARAAKKDLPDSEFLLPDPSLTGDNALMIATAAYFSGKKSGPDQEIRADANARLDLNE